MHSADELTARLGVPLLGQVPRPDRRLAQARQLATLSEPTGPSAEAFRILKNNLEISQLQHRAGSIVITSTTRGEGKSTTAANLAVILARSGRHIILVDLDLRHPSIDRFFGLDHRPGLTSVAGGVKLVDALNAVDVHPDRRMADAGMLQVMTGGPQPQDPGEFLLRASCPKPDGPGQAASAADRYGACARSRRRGDRRRTHGRADPRRRGEPGALDDPRRDPPRARGLPTPKLGVIATVSETVIAVLVFAGCVRR